MKAENRQITLQTENLDVGYAVPGKTDSFTRRAISVSAVRGEIIALIGPNGIGKSTLLKTLAGLIPKVTGQILVNGSPAGDYNPDQLSRLLSFVSTEKPMVPQMTVAELVAYGRFPYTGWLGTLKKEDHLRVREAISKVGITHLSGNMINEISDGERQRAMIARALAQDTPLIILDEPTAFLDISNTYAIFHLLHELARKEQKTIILSTHDLHLALQKMDKLWIMLDTATLEGAPEDAILRGWLQHLFPDDKVGFNASKGEFFFRYKPAGSLAVEGGGKAYTMTVKALERKGYQVTRFSGEKSYISVKEGIKSTAPSWELTGQESRMVFHSIYDLVSEL
ncbi:MAG TPA: ABC transporter ATP-binding protein [Prolixibacteraceae bacterium]|nr:ABC transporter ATP-binding protein [Prolixibacteraceae bacterium]